MPTRLELVEEEARRQGVPVEEIIRRGAKARGMDVGAYIEWVKERPVEIKAERERGALPTIPTRKASLLKTLAEPELIGGAALPMAAKAGGPLGVGLAALGGGAGEAGKQIYQHARGLPGAPETSLEAAQRIGMAGARMGGGQLLGGAIGKVGGKVLAPLASRVTEEAKIAMGVLNKYMPKRVTGRAPGILPAEATESKMLDILHNFAEYGLFTRKVAIHKNILRPAAQTQMIDDFLKGFVETEGEDAIGELFVLAAQKQLTGSRVVSSTLYKRVDEMTQGVMASTRKLKEFAAPLVKRGEALSGIEAHHAGDDLMRAVTELNDDIPFTALQELRSRLLSSIDTFSITNKKAPAIGKAKKLVEIIHQEMMSSLRRANPAAAKVLQKANQLYREGSEQFNNQLIRRLKKRAELNPEGIVKAIFQRGAVSNIKAAKTAVGGTDTTAWQQMQSWWVRAGMQNSKGQITGDAIESNLRKMGEPALKEILTLKQLTGLRDIATTLKVVESKQGEGTGRMLIQLTQGGMALALVTGVFEGGLERARPKEAAMVLLGPVILSRMFTNPVTAKWLIQGFKMPKGAPGAAALASKIGVEYRRIRRQEANLLPEPRAGQLGQALGAGVP